MVARRLARALFRTLGQPAKAVALAQGVYAHVDKGAVTDVEQCELTHHLEMLGRIYLTDEVEGWVSATRSQRLMRISSKRSFADPSLDVALLSLNEDSALRDWQTLSLLFENLCMRDLDVYARATGMSGAYPVRYYHDDANLGVDAVIELVDCRWGAFEIKLSHDKDEDGAKSLLRMRKKLLKDASGRALELPFLAVLIGVDGAVYRLPDGVLAIPIRALGA